MSSSSMFAVDTVIDHPDPALRDILHSSIMSSGSGFIAGGYAASLCRSAPSTMHPADIDIFPRTESELDYKVIVDLGYNVINESEISVTLCPSWSLVDHLDVQLIRPHTSLVSGHCTWGPPEKVVGQFDLTINQAYIVPHGQSFAVWSTEQCSYDLSDNKIKFTQYATNPIRCLYRALKYHRKGFDFAPYEAAKIVSLCQRLTADQIEVLTQFLDGVEGIDFFELEKALLLDLDTKPPTSAPDTDNKSGGFDHRKILDTDEDDEPEDGPILETQPWRLPNV